MDDENDNAYPYAQQPSTTAEAQKYSRQILDRTLSGANEKGEEAILSETQRNTSAAIQALKNAQASIQEQQYDPRLSQLAFASAVGQGNRAGSTWEGLAQGFGAAHDELAKQQQFNLQRQELMNKYGLDIAQAPQANTNVKLELQKLHEQQEGPLARAALTQLGRSIVPGSAMMAPNAKVAVSEGLQYGTPAFFNRVRQLDLLDQRNKSATAGTDEAPAEPDHSAEADKYGVPETAPYPWAGMSSKEARQAKNTERSKSLTELSKADDGVLQAQSVDRDLDRFMYLNQRHSTGYLQGFPVVKQITGFPSDAQEMDKISARIGPLMRQPGMGRMTNYDLQTFMTSVVGRDKSFQTNKDITTAMKVALQNQLGYNEFAHNYFAVHHTLQGARENWDQYLRDNPIFDPKSEPGSFTLNAGRKDYKTYFRSLNTAGRGGEQSGPSQFTDVTDADRNDPTLAGLSDAEIHAAKQPAQARGGPIRGYADGGKVTRNDDYKADLEDLARSFEQGATFSWGDELNAGLRPGPYRQNVTNERGQQERFSGTHPWGNLGLEVAGGAASTAAASKLAQIALEHAKGKAGAIGALAARASQLIPKSFLGKAALAGGAGGALAGAGGAQNMEDIPAQAGVGATLGALTGPLAGLVTKYGAGAAIDLVNKLRGQQVPNAAKKVLDALSADKITTDEVRTRLNRASRGQVPTTMGDVGGPNVQSLAQGVALKPGPRVQNYVDAMAERQKGANERVQDLVNGALKPDDYTQKLGELTKNLYNNAKPLYDQAYQQFPKVKSQAIYDILNTPTGAKAAKNAAKLMADDGVPIGKADATGMVKKPSLQYLDYVKRALDDIVEKSERAGNLNQARIVRNMRNGLRDELDTVTRDPNGGASLYQAARSQYAGDLEVLDALKMGRDGFGKMTSRDLNNATQNMSYAEKDALRTGAAESLFQQISQLPANSNPALKLMGNKEIQSKLRTLFDTDGEYNRFAEKLTQEMQNFARSRQIVANAARANVSSAAQGLDAGPPIGELAHEAALGASGHPVWMGARAAHALGNKLMPSGTAEGVADLLGTKAGPDANKTVAMLKMYNDMLAGKQSATNALGIGAAGAATSASAPEPWNNLQDNSPAPQVQ
jgi:hypothetical protein